MTKTVKLNELFSPAGLVSQVLCIWSHKCTFNWQITLINFDCVLFLYFSHIDVPCPSLSISVMLHETRLHSGIETVKESLDVSMTGSLQILECVEMPGAILVKWDEVR